MRHYVDFCIAEVLITVYIDNHAAMSGETRLTHNTALILQAIDSGFVYGFSIMEMTGLPSGTVYPAMRRMEEDQLIRSRWERQAIADREQRPRGLRRD
jgi:PadR family transcriptional regulator, regulatory protein PadR